MAAYWKMDDDEWNIIRIISIIFYENTDQIINSAYLNIPGYILASRKTLWIHIISADGGNEYARKGPVIFES